MKARAGPYGSYDKWPSGLRWKSGKVRCCVPMELARHKDPKTKGDRGLNSRESSFILVTLGELHSVGSCKSSK